MHNLKQIKGAFTGGLATSSGKCIHKGQMGTLLVRNTNDTNDKHRQFECGEKVFNGITNGMGESAAVEAVSRFRIVIRFR